MRVTNQLRTRGPHPVCHGHELSFRNLSGFISISGDITGTRIGIIISTMYNIGIPG